MNSAASSTERPRGKLTRRQQEYYDFICRFVAKHHRLPKYREISQGMRLVQASSVFSAIRCLIHKGYLSAGDSGGFQLPDVLPERIQSIQVKAGQFITLGEVTVGVFEVDRETGQVGLEVIAPEIMGDLEPDF